MRWTPSCARRGSHLIVRTGNPVEVLAQLAAEADATRVFAQEDYSPTARLRDRRVEQLLPLTLTPGTVVHHPTAVRKDDGSPFVVYTPFSRKWRSLDLPDLAPYPPQHIATPHGIASDPLPQPEFTSAFLAGETRRKRRCVNSSAGRGAPVFRYADERNRVDLAGTSALSPYLRFGMLSARQAVERRAGTR